MSLNLYFIHLALANPTVTNNVWLLLCSGFLSGILAGLLGIGGGTIVVPLLVALGLSPIESVATSSLTILITSISGTIQNWCLGYLDFKRVIYLGLPATLTAQLGVFLANSFPPYLILLGFGILAMSNIYLVNLRDRLNQGKNNQKDLMIPVPIARLITGSISGILAGLFGVGGGVVMVPLQLLLLKEKIKLAIQTSLGVVVITAISALLGHGSQGHVLLDIGITLGIGGLFGTQIATRLLPKIPDKQVVAIYMLFLLVLSIYVFWQAWQSYTLHRLTN